jgi:hypothetical protein
MKTKIYFANYYDRKYNWQFTLLPDITIENWNYGSEYKEDNNLFFITISWLFWDIVFGRGNNIE